VRTLIASGLDLLTLVLGALALTLALPNELFPEGLGFLGWVALLPVFHFTRRHRWLGCLVGALVFGFTLFLVSTFWLTSFHPLAFPIVILIVLPQFVAVFLVSGLLWRWIPRAWWSQAALWALFEWGRTLGPWAFPYGALSTTQAFFPLAIQSVDLFGTTGLTFLMAVPAALMVSWLGALVTVRELVLAALLLAANFTYGWWMLSRPEEGAKVTVALVQNVRDPWVGGVQAYGEALNVLIDLSRRGLTQSPDLVVWPETAFVPAIEWHTRYRTDPASWQLVKTLETFLKTTKVAFVIGNDHGVLAPDGVTRVDYNAARVWDQGWTGTYLKTKLVPFTEGFPWREQLPQVAKFLEDNGSHFWEAGKAVTVIKAGGIVLGTPICYEDAFSEVSRTMVRQGARLLVNLTNDSWSLGTASKNQHLAAAVFRTLETRTPLVRAGNDGRTVAVDSRGQIIASLPIGVREVLVHSVVLSSGSPPLYALWGDWEIILLVLLLILQVFSSFEAVRRPKPEPNAIDKGDNL